VVIDSQGAAKFTPRSISRLPQLVSTVEHGNWLEDTEDLHKTETMRGNRSTYVQQKAQIIGYRNVHGE